MPWRGAPLRNQEVVGSSPTTSRAGRLAGQNYRDINPTVGPGVAVREFPTKIGPVDYILFVDATAVETVEA